MVPDEPTEPTPCAPQRDGAGMEPSGFRRYDSFIVRLWRDDASPRLLRAEVEYVQPGLLIENVQVPVDWVLEVIRSCLRLPTSPPIDGTAQNQNMPPRPPG